MKFSVSVLINTCYGGFSLSDEFLIEIFKIYGHDDAIFSSRPVTDYDRSEYDSEDVIDIRHLNVMITKDNMGDVYDYDGGRIYTIKEDVIRYHAGVHAIFLRLGGSKNCSGQCSELELVDVGYEVEISSYDGLEEVVVNKIR